MSSQVHVQVTFYTFKLYNILVLYEKLEKLMLETNLFLFCIQSDEQ